MIDKNKKTNIHSIGFRSLLNKTIPIVESFKWLYLFSEKVLFSRWRLDPDSVALYLLNIQIYLRSVDGRIDIKNFVRQSYSCFQDWFLILIILVFNITSTLPRGSINSLFVILQNHYPPEWKKPEFYAKLHLLIQLHFI